MSKTCIDCDSPISPQATRCRSCDVSTRIKGVDPTPEEIAAMCKKIREENDAAGIIREKAPANLAARIYRSPFRR